MNKEAKHIQESIKLLTGLLLIFFISSILFFSRSGQSVSALAISPFPTIATFTPTPTTCTSWNLAGDFRRSPNQENPNRDSCNNPGIWEFMGNAGLARDVQSYYALSPFNPNGVGVSGFNMWGPDAAPYDAFNASGGTLYVFGVWPADTFRAPPGSAQLAIVAWHSPISGYVSVSGAVSDGDPGGGDGILWYIDRNSTNVASGGFSNGGSQTFASGTNGAGLNALAVAAGDTIYLAIHPNSNYYFDSTGIDITITTSAPTPTNTPTRNPRSTATPTSFCIFTGCTPTRTPTKTRTPMPTNTPPPNAGYLGSGYFPTNNLNRCHLGSVYAEQAQNASNQWSTDTDVNISYNCTVPHITVVYADFGNTKWAGKALICNTSGICDNDIALNSTYNSCQVLLNSYWIAGNPLYTNAEVQKMIMHELGHCFSLAHSSDPTSVMGNGSVPNAQDIFLINARY